MNFTEAIAEVSSITGRPDKNTLIQNQLNKAIAFFTLKAEFSKDLVEGELNIDGELYSDTLDISDLTRFRKFKYIKPRLRNKYLTSIDPTQLLGPNGVVQLDRYYTAGTNLIYTLGVKDTILDIGYYIYAPILTTATDNDNHWMLDMMPWMVVEKAASLVFKSIGDDVSSRQYETQSMDSFLALRRDQADSGAV